MQRQVSLVARAVVFAFLLALLSLSVPQPASQAAELLRPRGVPTDVIDEDVNLPVMALVEDCETVRLALGAAWEDAYDCRVFGDYLDPWEPDPDAADRAEALLKRGAAMYELVCCIDEGIISLKFARDSKAIGNLEPEIVFWRNELALASGDVAAYAEQAATLRAQLLERLANAAQQRLSLIHI